jgi:predicted metal-binding protein
MQQKDLEKYCRLALDGGASDAVPIHPGSVITAPWVRIKCQFGCPVYGMGHCCPPHTPTHDQTRAILDSYGRAILFHIEAPATEGRGKRYKAYMEMLIELEGTLFKDGYYKAFVFLSGPCNKCKKCGILTGNPCVHMGQVRPAMEACGIDVFQTARNNGFFIKTLSKKEDTHNDYCLMLVD